MQTVTNIGENALVERLSNIIAPGDDAHIVSGSGDDCAVIATPELAPFYELLKVDCVVEGIHFAPDTQPERVGWKALCRAISDIAAMGGTPRFALVTLLLPPTTPVATVEGWYRGLKRAGDRFGVKIVGGETASQTPGGTGAALSISLTGTVQKNECVFRSGARPGDLIGVTGKLGGSFDSGRHLDFIPRLEESRWLVTHAAPTSMMDLSDGLSKDLPRLAKASDVSYRIDPTRLPTHENVSIEQALCDGEDYELLVTIPAEVEELPLTIIGEILPIGDSKATPLEGGWEHFTMLD